jgi:hypothetical protein
MRSSAASECIRDRSTLRGSAADVIPSGARDLLNRIGTPWRLSGTSGQDPSLRSG